MSTCWKESTGELPAAIARIDRSIIIDAIGRQSLEHILSSMEMKNLFKLYLVENNNSQSHYLDYYYCSKSMGKESYPVQEISSLYMNYLDVSLPKSKKIAVPAFTREKRSKLKDYIQRPEERKMEEVKIILLEVEERIFNVLDEIFRGSFSHDLKKYIGL